MFALRHGRAVVPVLALAGAAVSAAARAEAPCVNAWVTSDAKVSAGSEMPNTFSLDALHASPPLAGLEPPTFCRKFYDLYFDGRRKNWGEFQQGLSLWSHTPQKPMASERVIELDPILLLNVHGSGYCGIQSGLLEAVYQSRPGGTPGKPAIDARRWFLNGIVHSVTDAFYDGRWHYYDVDQAGWAGDAEKEVWSVADVIADPKGYYGPKTTLKSEPFYSGDQNGKWVEKIAGKGSYTFQDTIMAGHEMAFALRKGESFTRFFSQQAAGWAEPVPPPTKPMDKSGTPKGCCEIVYAPAAADAAAAALAKDGGNLVLAIRCPYNITSSKVEATGAAEVSTDLGRTWTPLAADGVVPQAINRWDYLLKVPEGGLKKVTTRGILHPGSLPRVGGAGPTTMTVRKMADHQVLTWVPDWSTEAAFDATAKRTGALKYNAKLPDSLSGGGVQGNGEITIPVKAPPGTKLVKLAALVMGSAGTVPEPDKYLALAIGPAGAAKLVAQSTDCSMWGKDPKTKCDHWENNVAGGATFDPCDEAEIKVTVRGWGGVRGARIYAGYVPAQAAGAGGTLVVTHGFDGKTAAKEIPVADLAKGPVSYPVAEAAKTNEFVRLEMR